VTSADEITRHDDFDPDGVEFVTPLRDSTEVSVVESDPTWPSTFEELAMRIRGCLGDQVLALEHVGSTSVAGLAAKPVIDIDITVADSSDEASYVPALAGAGFELLLREPGWHQHRCMVCRSPRANLHVWSPDSPEAIRHRMFRDWLREHPDDRGRYADAKRVSAAATTSGDGVMDYNQRKQPVIREILDRMFRANGLLD
jgi:GrpB-like predicted nucleotidyltransferase (UPF0157 family)